MLVLQNLRRYTSVTHKNDKNVSLSVCLNNMKIIVIQNRERSYNVLIIQIIGYYIMTYRMVTYPDIFIEYIYNNKMLYVSMTGVRTAVHKAKLLQGSYGFNRMYQDKYDEYRDWL